VQLSFEEVKELIPQRFPFIMIDKVTELEPGKHVVAVKNVSGNDIFFLGHFPEKAVMPGAAIIEAMAQASIVLFAAGKDRESDEKRPLYYFGSVKARFLNPVVPGDQIVIRVVNVKTLPAGAYVSGEAFVEDRKIAEADLVFSAKKDE
jgi:3-hydroxyacyl-[acyl-carrier-protein] dehydratase